MLNFQSDKHLSKANHYTTYKSTTKYWINTYKYNKHLMQNLNARKNNIRSPPPTTTGSNNILIHLMFNRNKLYKHWWKSVLKSTNSNNRILLQIKDKEIFSTRDIILQQCIWFFILSHIAILKYTAKDGDYRYTDKSNIMRAFCRYLINQITQIIP